MHVSGSCHCGAIRIEADVREDWVVLCYCTDCQVFSGSAFRGAVMAPRETMVVSGRPKTYVKVSQCGVRRIQAFCTDCGTPLFSDNEMETTSPYVSVRLGFLEQRDALVPNVRTWRRSALRWCSELEAIPSLEQQDFASLTPSQI